MKKYLILTIFFFLTIFISCTPNQRQEKIKKEKTSQNFAQLFDIDTRKGFPLITLKNPWGDATVQTKLWMVDHTAQIPDSLPADIQIIRTPVKSVSVMSGTDVAFLDLLDELDKIKAVGDFKLIKNPVLKRRIEQGEIKETGTNGAYKEEQFLAVDPDVAFITSYQNQSVEKLKRLGIQVIPVTGYMENHPLGRAAWLQFFSYFFNKEKLADSLFQQTVKKYSTLKRKTDSIRNKPTIFSGKPYGGVWYQPGGQSFIAKLFEDAGLNYLWKSNTASGGLPLDFETVYARAADADYWRLVVKHPGKYSYNRLMQEDPRYEDFKAFQDKKVIMVNVNDALYYEKGPTEPDVILADLIHAVHPDLLPDYEPVYYKILQP